MSAQECLFETEPCEHPLTFHRTPRPMPELLADGRECAQCGEWVWVRLQPPRAA